MFKTKLPTASEMVPFVMGGWAAQHGRETGAPSAFAISGELVPNSAVGTKTGLLPLLCWHADKIYQYGMGDGLNLTYRTNPTALLGVTVDLARVDKPISEVLCFMAEALLDLHSNCPKNPNAPGSADLSLVVDQFKNEIELARSPQATPVEAARPGVVAP